MSLSLYRRQHGLCYRHTPTNPRVYQGRIGTQASGPLCQMKSFVASGNPFRISLVAPLLCGSRPIAVGVPMIIQALRTMPASIASVIISTLYRMGRTWRKSHIFQKHSEVGSPELTNDNPSPSVVGVDFPVCVIATAQDPFPYGMFASSAHSMRPVIVATMGNQQTTARTRVIRNNIAIGNVGRRTANTHTVPSASILALARPFAQHGQPSERLPRQINKFTIGITQDVHSPRQIMNRLVRAFGMFTHPAGSICIIPRFQIWGLT